MENKNWENFTRFLKKCYLFLIFLNGNNFVIQNLFVLNPEKFPKKEDKGNTKFVLFSRKQADFRKVMTSTIFTKLYFIVFLLNSIVNELKKIEVFPLILNSQIKI